MIIVLICHDASTQLKTNMLNTERIQREGTLQPCDLIRPCVWSFI